MPRQISTRELVDALRATGFVEKSKSGSHLMFRHERTGLLVTIPTDRPFVPLVHLRNISQQLHNYRINPPPEIRRMLEG
jgi:predicted RNA binding protein YcfA (HicA-like mRNA interferase family)